LVVPNVKQPLFDSLSKARLEPGSEILPAVADGGWLIQKHRDMLMDFVDVEPDEKEYIMIWDAYIVKQRITSEHFLPRAFLSFVKDKAQWIVAKPSRAYEFSKHLLVLRTRNVIDDNVLTTAFQYINEARIQKPLEEPKELAKPKSVAGCNVCGKLVLGPSHLICSDVVRIPILLSLIHTHTHSLSLSLSSSSFSIPSSRMCYFSSHFHSYFISSSNVVIPTHQCFQD
jgi:hypothetical protein